VADALSRRHSLLSTMEVQVLGFEVPKELYKNDLEFGNVWESRSKGSFNHFMVQKVFFSRTTDCAFLSVLYEGQLFRKFMEEVWRDILGETRLLLLCKKTFSGLS
jgi:hypothetical protein